MKIFVNGRNESLQVHSDSHLNVLPLAIHSDTIANLNRALHFGAPRNGNTFWWVRNFHVIASL